MILYFILAFRESILVYVSNRGKKFHVVLADKINFCCSKIQFSNLGAKNKQTHICLYKKFFRFFYTRTFVFNLQRKLKMFVRSHIYQNTLI